MHDPRLGRFFAVDPLAPKYPHNSPYAFSENDVIRSIDLEGLERYIVIFDSHGKNIKNFDAYSVEKGAHGKLGYGTLVYYPSGSVSYFENGNEKSLKGYITGSEAIDIIKTDVEDSKSILTSTFTSWIEGKINSKKSLRDAEKYVLKRFPNDARQAQDVPDVASFMAQKMNGIVGGIHNGKADAIRHALWNALTAKESGSLEFTEAMTTAHEQDREKDQPLGEKLMDLNNNAIGRDVYKESGFFDSDQDIYESIIDRAAKGELQVYDPATDTVTNFKLTKSEVIKLKKLKVESPPPPKP